MNAKTFSLPFHDWHVVVETLDDFSSGNITFDGHEVTRWSNAKALRRPQEHSLPDGSALYVHLRRTLRGLQLDLRRNGFPLSGSARDPTRRVADAVAFLFFIAVLNILLGLAILTADDVRAVVVTSSAFFVAGFIFLGLAYLARRCSIAAMSTSVGLLTLAVLIQFRPTEASPGFGQLLGYLFLMVVLVRGIIGARALRNLEGNAQHTGSMPSLGGGGA